MHWIGFGMGCEGTQQDLLYDFFLSTDDISLANLWFIFELLLFI